VEHNTDVLSTARDKAQQPVRVLAADLCGVDARPVDIQASLHGHDYSPPRILGLPDAAVREAYHRVRTAFRSIGLRFPKGQVVVNLAPARTHKAGSGFDLGIALALAAVSRYLPRSCLAGTLVVGEVGLDGQLRAVPGILPMAELANRLGVPRLLCPDECAALAKCGAGSTIVLPAATLAEALLLCREGGRTARAVAPLRPLPGSVQTVPDLGRVRGQDSARLALILAAAGGHNLLMSGPPGCGKTLLARCLPGILPPLTDRERLEVLRVRSAFAAGEPSDAFRILADGLPPFRAPHHTVSYAGLVGGGKPIRPGEVTLAHRGVLFLDELPEFQRPTLEALRQPIECGQVHIRRAQEALELPAHFLLIAAMNPCPCGNLGHPTLPCTDHPLAVQRYRSRISGPLLDRFDLLLHLAAVAPEELLREQPQETALSPSIRDRIVGLRSLQMARNGGALNRDLDEQELRSGEHLCAGARGLLLAHCRGGRLSARAITRVLRVARTVADWEGRPRIEEADLARALVYRG
jgi:magnesium chelatase family protein